MWAGTQHGLSRFDGKNFKIFSTGINLPSLAVTAVFEDRNKNIWIGTRNGMALLQNSGCTVFPANSRDVITYVLNFYEDDNGRLYAFTDKGAFIFSGKSWQKTYMSSSFKNNICRQVIQGKEKELFMNLSDGIVLKKNDGNETLIAAAPPGHPFTFIQYIHGELFAATDNEIFHLENNKLKPIFSDALKGKPIFTFYADRQMRIWIASGKDGIMISRPGDFGHLDKAIVLPANLISSFMEDENGNIWIAGFTGLTVARMPAFSEIYKMPERPFSVLGNIFRGAGNDLYFGSAHEGLFTIRDNKFIPVPSLKNNSAAKELAVSLADAFAAADSSHLWVSTRSRKLYSIINGDAVDISYMLHKKEEAFIPSLAYDLNNQCLYVCTDRLLRIQNNICTPVLTVSGAKEIQYPASVFIDAGGRVFINTAMGQLFTVNAGGRAEDISSQSQLHNLGEAIYCSGADGSTWIAAPGEGIRQYEYEDNKLRLLKKITSKNGLPGNVIISMAFDKAGFLWLLTTSGLVRVDVKHPYKEGIYFITFFSEQEGVKYENWNNPSIMADKEGNILLCSAGGISKCNVDRLYGDSTAPSVQIESVILNKAGTDILAENIPLYSVSGNDDEHTLSYRDNSLTIFFNGISMSHAKEMMFAYTLSSNDSSWSMPSGNDFVSFINLSPGKYTFRVKARKSNTVWSDPVNFFFYIKPPFWDTWWFRLLSASVIAFAIFFAVWKWMQRIKKKTALEKKLGELELKALKAQMNPHFIYNAMNSIQSLIIHENTDDAIIYIGKFSRLLRNVLDQSDKALITLEQELDSLKFYFELESLRLEIRPAYHVISDDDIFPETEYLPPMTLQPFVENAVWHGLSNKTGDKKLDIYISCREDFIVFEIIDNGIGRKAHALLKSQGGTDHASKGFDITRNRLALFNNRPGTDPVLIEDLYTEEGLPAGTKVTVKILRTNKPNQLLLSGK